jgi:hypothetical protein
MSPSIPNTDYVSALIVDTLQPVMMPTQSLGAAYKGTRGRCPNGRHASPTADSPYEGGSREEIDDSHEPHSQALIVDTIQLVMMPTQTTWFRIPKL